MPIFQIVHHAVAWRFFVLCIAACSGTVEIAPRGHEAFTPPPFYGDYWKRVEQCSGFRGDFARVRWFVYPNDWYIPNYTAPDGGHAAALSRWGAHEIYLAKLGLQQSAVVRHEMLHELLQTSGHPAEFFDWHAGKCRRETLCFLPEEGPSGTCSDLASLYP